MNIGASSISIVLYNCFIIAFIYVINYSRSLSQLETVARVYHMTKEDVDQENAPKVLQDIRRLVFDCLVKCGKSECTILPTTPHTEVDMSR